MKKSPPSAPDLFAAGAAPQPPRDEPKPDPKSEPKPDEPLPLEESRDGKPSDDGKPPEPKPEAKPPATQRPTQAPVPFDPKNTGEMFRYAWFLSGSELVPKALRGKQHDILIVLLKGRDLGLKPLQSISNINVIDGKAEVGALLMVSLVLKSGFCESWRLVHSDTKRAVYETRRIGQEITPFEYTIEEAEQMGLLDKGRTDWARENNQWKKQPRTMLRRRAQSMLAREVYPDVVIGLYDHDELREATEHERIGLTVRDVAEAIEVPSTAPIVAPRPIEVVTKPPEPSKLEALPAAREPTDLERIAAASRAATAAVAELVPVVAARSTPVDPLKARLAERVEATAVRRCTGCGDELDERDSDPCWACRDGANVPETTPP